MAKLKSPLKTFGGKGRLRNWIIENFPANYTEISYGEPFLGGGSVLFGKKLSVKEVVSDFDPATFQVFWEIKNDVDQFVQALLPIQYDEATFERFRDLETTVPFNLAVQEFVVRRMSRSGMRKNFAFTARTRGGIPGDINAWNNTIEQLPLISNRLQNVELLNKDFRDFEFQDFNYLDPPYFSKDRVSTDVYQREMKKPCHEALLDMILSSSKLFLLSGYDNPLYADRLRGWRKISKNVANNAGQTRVKSGRIEMLWANY